MPAAALTSKSKRNASRPVFIDATYAPLEKRPLPAGRPREWYITHNRRLKAMRLAIALLDSGVYLPNQANNTRIRSMAEDVGIHPPSDITCHMVRALMRYSR
ncbi:hypothetical protein [Streptomyces sp. BA2]|uniref:hypothetical protein n=1 Tax=Streptomyces sp. BA2 TaxID=436595 RepID=UPI001321C5C3|nr:hypothetical protein [Streptomyces sp. BA2]